MIRFSKLKNRKEVAQLKGYKTFVTNTRCLAVALSMLALAAHSCTFKPAMKSGVSEFSQNAVLLEHNGYYWSRHVLAVQGYNYATPPVAKNSDRIYLEVKRAGTDAETVLPAQTLRTTNITQELLKHENENKQISLFHEIPNGGLEDALAKYRISGSNEVFFVGCLLKQFPVEQAATRPALRDTIKVPRAPLLTDLNRRRGSQQEVELTEIHLKDAKWIWELIPDLNPNAKEVSFLSSVPSSNDASPFQRLMAQASLNLKNWYFYADNEIYKTTAGGHFFARKSFADYSLSRANPPELAMLERLARQQSAGTPLAQTLPAQTGSVSNEEHVCATLIEPVDTMKNYVSFGIEAAVTPELIAEQKGNLNVAYLKAVERNIKENMDFVSANATGIASATLFLGGSLIAIGAEPWLAFLPAPAMKLIKGGFGTNMTITSSAGLLSNRIEELRKTRKHWLDFIKEPKTVNLPEY